VRPKHYWLHELRRGAPTRFAAPPCDPDRVFRLLRDRPNDALSWLDRALAILTTPFKRIGISGWTPTGCVAEAHGVAVRDAQHSTDGFWTIDLRLSTLTVGERNAPANRYLRVEVEPGTKAHDVCAEFRVVGGTRLEVGGEVVVDEDPPPFPEIHPDARFRIVS
jgi:hypothetical protein